MHDAGLAVIGRSNYNKHSGEDCRKYSIDLTPCELSSLINFEQSPAGSSSNPSTHSSSFSSLSSLPPFLSPVNSDSSTEYHTVATAVSGDIDNLFIVPLPSDSIWNYIQPAELISKGLATGDEVIKVPKETGAV